MSTFSSRSSQAVLALALLVVAACDPGDEGDSEASSGAGAESSNGSATSGTGAEGSGSTSGSTNLPSAPIELDDLCPLFTSDLCLYLTTCGDSGYRDAAHCENELQCFGLEQLHDSADSGRVTYNPAEVGVCHARFVDDPCGFASSFIFVPDIFEVLAECENTLMPHQKAGSECVSHGECETSYCSKEGRSCPGTCTEKPTEEDPCPTGDCEQGPIVGEPCGLFEEDGVSSFVLCEEGWCDFELVVQPVGSCQKDGDQGEPCSGGADCTGKLRCLRGVADDRLGSCNVPAGAGSLCITNQDCEAGLFCADSSCLAQHLVGSACSSDADCVSGLCGETALCVTPAYPGDSCADGSSECVKALCVSGSCVRRQRVGEPCAESSECATFECAGGVCVDDSVCDPGQ